MLQAHLRRALMVLNDPEAQGPHAHPEGLLSLRSRSADVFAALAKAEQVAQALGPALEPAYVSGIRKSATDQLRTSAFEIANYALQTPQANFAHLRYAAEKEGYFMDNSGDMLIAATESILVEVYKRSYDVSVSVYAGETLKAKLETEAKEIERALKVGNMEDLSVLLRGLINRAECILNQDIMPQPPRSSNGQGWGGCLGVELASPGKLGKKQIQLWLDYELHSRGMRPTYILRMRPPLLVAPKIARRLAQGQFAEVPVCEDPRDLRSLLGSLKDCSETRSITTTSPDTFQTISFFTVAGVQSEIPVEHTPAVGRMAHADLHVLEEYGPRLIRRLANMNNLLTNTFGTTGHSSAAPSTKSKRSLLLVTIDTYVRGLSLKIQGEVNIQLHIDTEQLVVESVEPASLEQARNVGTQILQESLYLPAVVHTFAYFSSNV